MSQSVEPTLNSGDADTPGSAPSSSASESLGDILSTLVGGTPIVRAKMVDTDVDFTMDSGSQVTIVNESFFDRHLRSKLGKLEDASTFLKLRAANGLELPFIGYFVVDIEVFGRLVRDRGILVQKNNGSPSTSKSVGLLGMNVLGEIPEFTDWIQERQKEESKEAQKVSGKTVKLAYSTRTCIPAWSVTHVRVTGPEYSGPCIVERLDNPLPGNLKLVQTFVDSREGNFQVQLVNFSTQDVWLPSHLPVGQLSGVDVVDKESPDVSFVEVSANEVLVDVQPVRSVNSEQKTSGDKAGDKDMSSEPGLEDWLSGVTVPKNLDPAVKQKLMDILRKNHQAFAKHDDDIGRTTTIKQRIHTTDDIPVRQPHRRIAPHLYGEVKTHIKELLRKGIIRESKSEYASPIVVCRKKNGQVRMCADYRKLNQKVVGDSFPLPRIDESLESLAGAKYYSTVDLKSAYTQVEVDERDIHKTAITTPFGLYEHLFMPFGIKTSPNEFQRLMQIVFRDELHWMLLVFLDDLIIYAKTIDEHLDKLDIVLQRLIENNLKAEPSKCLFLQEYAKFLGKMVSERGIECDPAKIQAVEEWPVPTNTSELGAFLGTVGYHRRHIKNFSQIAKPLHELLSMDPNRCKKKQPGRKRSKPKDTHWRWEEIHDNAFQTLKTRLVTAPVLGFPDFSKPFTLETDASHQGLGAVLLQEQDGETRVIAYASRGLRGPERNMASYSSMKLELLALKWAITEKFPDYLSGNPFVVYTDNNPLCYIQTSAKLKAVEQRWVSELARFRFTIKYRPSKLNGSADGLSRKPNTEYYTLDEEEVADAMGVTIIPTDLRHKLLESVTVMQTAGINEVQLEVQPPSAVLPNISKEELLEMQRQDPEMSQVWKILDEGRTPTVRERRGTPPGVRDYLKQWSKLTVHDGLLHRVVKDPSGDIIKQVLWPRCLREKTLETMHDTLGHQGVERTELLIRSRCFWPRMARDIKQYVENCERCRVAKMPHKKIRTPMRTITAKEPNEVLAIDFTLLEEASNGMENALVLTDVFSKYSQAVGTQNQKASTVAKMLVKHWFFVYGVPHRIHSDQGKCFDAKIVKNLYNIYGIDKTRTAPYSPPGNGQCERFNLTLHGLLVTLQPQQKSRWPEHLQEVTYAYNVTPHSGTGFSPFYLMMGRNPRLPIDSWISPEGEDSTTEWVEKHREGILRAYQKATENLKSAALKRKKVYDRAAKEHILPIGSHVYLRSRPMGRNKIQDAWDPQIHVIAERRENVYGVQPVSGKRGTRYINRKDLQPCVQQPQEMSLDAPRRKRTQRQNRAKQDKPLSCLSESSEDSDVGEIDIAIPRLVDDSSDEESQSEEEPEEIPLRRSARANKGQHSNPHHLPRTAVRQVVYSTKL